MNKACKLLPPWKCTAVLQDYWKEGKCAVCSGLLQEAKREGDAGQGDSFLSGSPRAFWRLKAAEFPGRSPEAMNASQELWEGDSARRGSRFGASAMWRFLRGPRVRFGAGRLPHEAGEGCGPQPPGAGLSRLVPPEVQKKNNSLLPAYSRCKKRTI